MFPSELPGDGFTLRMIRPEDARAILAFWSRPEVIEPTSSEGWTLQSLTQFAIANVEGAESGAWCRYGIIPDGAPQAVGTVGFGSVDLRNKRAEIGYDLTPEYWGSGMMTRAASVLIDWAFEAGFNRIEATVMAGNRRSERVLEKLGLEREALLREYKLVRGSFRDYSMWSVLARDWANR